MNERLELLTTWAPFLLGGFALNILISVVAVLIGTALGSILVAMRFSTSRNSVAAADTISSFFRNIPTLVLLFYLATFIPNEIAIWDGYVVEIPKWLKAAIAMSAAPLGLTYWNLHASIISWKNKNRSAALLFIPNCTSGLTMTILSSSTSSLVGVSEIVHRCNAVIAVTGSSQTILVYAFASSIFVTFCLSLSWISSRMKIHLLRRYS